jgi:hypothetical protein
MVCNRLTTVCKICLTGPVIGNSRHTKTGLGRQVMLESTLVPRSRAGQIMYGKRMKKVDHWNISDIVRSGMDMQLTAQPNMRVHKKAPTKPSMVFFGLSLINGVLPNALPVYQWRTAA